LAIFLTTEWFEELNRRFATALEPPKVTSTTRVVFDLLGANAEGPHALTFTIDPDGARVEPGDHLAADIIVALSVADAQRLASGDLNGGRALREGRVKVRGDVNALSDLGAWIVAAQTSSATAPPDEPAPDSLGFTK